MMQKNERVLLVPWVRYHAIRFGIRNLFVFDNGSDDKETILKLEMLEKEGLNVFWEYKEKSDFELKGKIISDKIKSLDSDEGYDFYFPMDCDEFLCVRDSRGVRIDKRSIENEINKYFNKEKIFYIDSALFNNPVIEDEFMILSRPEKCFFSNDTCNKLDTGFHQGEIKSGGGRQDTCISYIHFHNKPYDHYLFHARQKMKNRLENFGPGDAARYISQKGAGAHLVSRMLKTRDEYNQQFANRSNEPFPVKGIVAVPEFRAHLEEIGAPIIWTDRQEPPVLALDNGGRNSQHDIFGWWVDSGPNWTEMKGYVDAVQSDQGRVTFAGWACDRDGWPAPQLIVMADTDIVPTREFKTVYRPDVGSILPEVGPFCGFHIVVEAADVPPDTHELRLVSHDPRDRSTRIVQGRFGTAIRWSELKAGRNLWNVPDETDRGPRALLRQWKEELPTLPDDRRTRLHRADYLGPIRDGVRFFSQFQDGRGAIIDPYKGEEFQYSTPCFAFAAALAAREDDGAILTERAALAMDWSCQTLAERKAATGHEDFFPSPIAHALSLLADRVEPSRLSGWRKLLAGFDPFLTYRHKVGGSGDPGSNWNCKALAGEYLLHKAGVRGSLDYVERSLLAQGRLFNNEFGMYAEGPMVYDAFPRAWLGDMLAAGYDGQAVAELKETLDRGDATSLFLQSPNGELPCGGRSAHHIWADALQCVIFELAAAKAKKQGELELAGIYKRAARKVLKAIRYWQRPTGEFWIVKNQSHPALRHGYEGYSSHSQYNLLALIALGYAYQHAEVTDSVDEQLTPSEGGHYVVDLPSPFNKVVANNNGTQVIVAHRRESTQTPVGLLRVHFKEGVPQIGPSDGLLAETGYALPDTKRANLSIGIAWRASEGWRSLADMSEPTVGISDIVASRRETKFKMSYDIKDEPVSRVTETYCLSENRMQVDYELVGAPDAVAVRLPIIVSDGRNENTVKVGENFVEVTIDRRMVAYIVQNAKLKISSELYAHRNGFARIAEFECGSNRNVRLTMEYSEKRA